VEYETTSQALRISALLTSHMRLPFVSWVAQLQTLLQSVGAMRIDWLREHCLSLPHTTEHVVWEDLHATYCPYVGSGHGFGGLQKFIRRVDSCQAPHLEQPDACSQ